MPIPILVILIITITNNHIILLLILPDTNTKPILNHSKLHKQILHSSITTCGFWRVLPGGAFPSTHPGGFYFGRSERLRKPQSRVTDSTNRERQGSVWNVRRGWREGREEKERERHRNHLLLSIEVSASPHVFWFNRFDGRRGNILCQVIRAQREELIFTTDVGVLQKGKLLLEHEGKVEAC